ncbi:Protein zntD [Durusdinium trenchii]
MMPKWIFALAIFIVAALGALAAKLAERKGGRLMALAEAFVAGGLLNAALVHLLADNIGTLDEVMMPKNGEGEPFPLAPLLCGLGALMTHFVEGIAEPLMERMADRSPAISGQVVGHKAPMPSVASTNSNSDKEQNQEQQPIGRQLPFQQTEVRLNCAGPLLLLALTFHSLMEGTSLGASQADRTMDIFLPIIAHKGMAAFTLGINWGSLGWYALAMLVFSLVSPVGVLVGTTAEGSVAASILLSLSAGTFLYIGLVETMPGVRKPWLPSMLGRAAQMGVCTAGFAAMGTLALWA